MEKNRYYSKQDLIYRKVNFSENEWEKIVKERLEEKKEINIFSKDNKKCGFVLMNLLKIK